MSWIRLFLEPLQVMGLMVLAAGLMGRTVVLRRDLTLRDARVVLRLDFLAWSGALLAAISHLVLVLTSATSTHWSFLMDPLEWGDAVVFFSLVGFQIPVFLILRGWPRYLVREQAPWYTDRHHDLLRWAGRSQVVLAFTLPLLPPLVRMAFGPGG